MFKLWTEGINSQPSILTLEARGEGWRKGHSKRFSELRQLYKAISAVQVALKLPSAVAAVEWWVEQQKKPALDTLDKVRALGWIHHARSLHVMGIDSMLDV